MKEYLKVFFSPKGRIARLDFFLFSLLLSILSNILLYFAEGKYFDYVIKAVGNIFFELGVNPASVKYVSYFILSLLVFIILVCIYCNIILFIKRWHDINYSGWWVLLALIPLVNLLVVILLLFLPGTQGVNRFGQQWSMFSRGEEKIPQKK